MQINFLHIFFGPPHKQYQKLNDDLPDPESPVMTTNLSLGISKDIFFKLCSFAPFITYLFKHYLVALD